MKCIGLNAAFILGSLNKVLQKFLKLFAPLCLFYSPIKGWATGSCGTEPCVDFFLRLVIEIPRSLQFGWEPRVMWGPLLNFLHCLSSHCMWVHSSGASKCCLTHTYRWSTDQHDPSVLNDESFLTLLSSVNSKCCHGNTSCHKGGTSHPEWQTIKLLMSNSLYLIYELLLDTQEAERCCLCCLVENKFKNNETLCMHSRHYG